MQMKRSQFAGMNQHYRWYGFESYLNSMQRNGIQSLELWCGAPHFLLDSEKFSDPDRYERMARERGLKFVSVCAPSMLWQHQYGTDAGERRNRAVRYYCNGVRVASALGCKIMSLNAGWGYWDENPEESVKRSIEAVSTVADFAQAQGITLALETLQPVESNIVLTLKEAEAYYSRLNHPAVKMMTDTVAVGVAGETVDDWFNVFGKDIVHCHLVDGSPSGHRVFGDGNYPLAAIMHTFAENNYTGFFTMELGGNYLQDPFSADARNMKVLSNYFVD